MARNSRKQNLRIAMLIDGDNAQASLIEKMLVETAKYGVASVRRIYGDWTEANMNQWKKTLHSNAIQPIQQFRNTVGKNATDSALIIDAMDLLHSQRVDSFCIVSSDSDYTRLATRIREEGMFVIGIGKKTTPIPFVVACDVFVHVENLANEDELVTATNTTPKTKSSKQTGKAVKNKPEPLPLLIEAFNASTQENGWALLSTMGTVLRQIKPDFDTRSFGYKQLGQLFRALSNDFEFDETGNQIRYIGD
jgi:uncharacterized protein (TIGR00288 family)